MRVWGALGVLLLEAVACAPLRRDGAAPAVHSSSESPGGEEDSLRALEEQTTDVPEEAIAEVLTAANDAATHGPAPGRPQRTRPTVEGRITAIRGVRNEAKATLGVGQSLEFGFRAVDSNLLGFVSVRRDGFFRGIVAGNLGLRMGEGLVLGRELMGYTAIGARGVARGLAVSPSLSRWFSRRGAAVRFGGDRWRAEGVAVARTGELDELVPAMAWLAAETHSSAAHAGVTVGTSIDREWVVSTPRIVSVHGSFRSEMFQGSGEVAVWLPRQPYVAVRFSHPGSWAARYIRAPGFSPATSAPVDPALNGTVEEGVAWDAGTRLFRTTWRTALYAGTNRSPRERRRVRRVTLGVSGRHQGFAWEGSMAAIDDVRTRAPDDPTWVVESRRTPEMRIRARVQGPSHAVLTHTITLDYRPRRRWHSEGLGLVVATEASFGRLETTWQLAAYSMGPGQRRLLTRPGVGSLEWASWVYGKGSDVSLRVRLRVAEKLFLMGYYGEPWLKPHRVYIGAELTLR